MPMMIGSSPLALAVGGSPAPRAYLGSSLVYEAEVLSPPVRVSAPGITGSLVVGQTLTIGPPAVYSGNPEPTITYSWQSRPNGGGTIISHSNGTSFALTEDLAGRQIRTRDMASNSQGSVGWSVGAWSAAVAAPVAAWDVQGGDQQVLILAMPPVPSFVVTGGDQSLIIEAEA